MGTIVESFQHRSTMQLSPRKTPSTYGRRPGVYVQIARKTTNRCGRVGRRKFATRGNQRGAKTGGRQATYSSFVLVISAESTGLALTSPQLNCSDLQHNNTIKKTVTSVQHHMHFRWDCFGDDNDKQLPIDACENPLKYEYQNSWNKNIP